MAMAVDTGIEAVMSRRHIEKRVLSREGTLACVRSSSETVFPKARDWVVRYVVDEEVGWIGK